MEKLDDDLKESEAHYELIRKACKQVDAEQAINELLGKHPNSPTLLTAQGCRLANAKNYKAAREPLRRALNLDPTRILTLSLLADVERKLNHLEESIDYLCRAIAIETRREWGWRYIFDHRRNASGSYARLANTAIDQGKSSEERRRAAPNLMALEANLAALDVLRGREPLDGLSAHKQEFEKPFYGAIIASCRAVLAADVSDLTEARRLAAEANENYDKALRILNSGPADIPSFRTGIAEQRQNLKIRMAKYLPPTEGKPQTAVAEK